MSALLGTIACSQDGPVAIPPPPPAVPPPPPASPGPLTVRLTTPNADDGALFLELKGPSIRSLTAASAAIKVYADTTSTTTVRTAVAGNLTTGALFTFEVPDVSAAATYTVTILDISDRQNRLRNGSSGYTLTIAP